jgi:putative transposase
VSGLRCRRVGIGDRILVAGRPSVVISVTGSRVRLADEEGTVRTVTAAELAADPRFEIVAAAPSGGTRPEIGMEGLPAAAVEEASWWEAHIAEVVYGLRPDAPAGSCPRPQYDPERTSLTEREKAKAAELAAAGRPVPASTVKHRRQRWEAHGLAGLVDRRVARRMRPAGRASERVVDAMRQAIGEAAGASSRTAGFVIWRTREILAEAGYDGPVPSERTFYRLFGTLSHGRHTTGSASTRRSLAGRPEGMFGSVPAACSPTTAASGSPRTRTCGPAACSAS